MNLFFALRLGHLVFSQGITVKYMKKQHTLTYTPLQGLDYK